MALRKVVTCFKYVPEFAHLSSYTLYNVDEKNNFTRTEIDESRFDILVSGLQPFRTSSTKLSQYEQYDLPVIGLIDSSTWPDKLAGTDANASHPR